MPEPYHYVSPMDTPRPDADLAKAVIAITPNDGIMLDAGEQDNANGRVFKWLMGQIQHAREPPPPPMTFRGFLDGVVALWREYRGKR